MKCLGVFLWTFGECSRCILSGGKLNLLRNNTRPRIWVYNDIIYKLCKMHACTVRCAALGRMDLLWLEVFPTVRCAVRPTAVFLETCSLRPPELSFVAS